MSLPDWKFERSSGYAGYRCKNCGHWVYADGERKCNCVMTLDEAIKIAKSEVKDSYALSYLHAIDRAVKMGGTVGLESQIMYALGNMKQWRGENARQVKKVMNDWIKKNQKRRKESLYGTSSK